MAKSWKGKFCIYQSVEADSMEEAVYKLKCIAERAGWDYDDLEDVEEFDDVDLD